MILAGDIGGTNTRLALFETGPFLSGTHASSIQAAALEVFPSGKYKGPEEIALGFLAKHNARVNGACFGIAGPVRDGKCKTPNLAWEVDSREVAKALKLGSAGLINDLEANAHGIAVLGPEDLVELNPGTASPEGARALISAGTGLGEAGLLYEKGGYRPFPSEGGHAEFAPRTDLQIELLQHLMKKFGHVSFERVLSGPGLFNIYEFLRDTGRFAEPPALAEAIKTGNPTAAVSNAGLEGTAEIAVEALTIFVSIYGAEAGNMALRLIATGGVFLGGGIAPRIIAKLREGGFRSAFADKGRLSSMVASIPVKVIMNDKTALLGAARVASLSAAAAAA